MDRSPQRYQGRACGSFVTKPTKELGDITADVWNSVFTDMYKSGRGPTYMDCTEIAEKDLKYMMRGLEDEGNTAMLKYMEDEGIDIRKRRVEFAQYEPFLIGRGVEIDLNGETNVAGMYVAGDPVGTSGRYCRGGNVRLDRRRKCCREGKEDSAAWGHRRESPRERTDAVLLATDDKGEGPGWQEANLALQQIMDDYAGTAVRSETLLAAGLKH